MNLFYHLVGLTGSRDFEKTVARAWTWEEIEPALELPASEKQAPGEKVLSRLGYRFNIWGVPAGAERTWNLLREDGSYILLVRSISIHGNDIPFGG